MNVLVEVVFLPANEVFPFTTTPSCSASFHGLEKKKENWLRNTAGETLQLRISIFPYFAGNVIKGAVYFARNLVVQLYLSS